MKEFLDSSDVSEVKKLLAHPPIVVLFHSTGCGHCIATKPHWNDLVKSRSKYNIPPEVMMISVGDSAIPSDEGVSGVPHFRRIDKHGKKTDVIGEKDSVRAIADALGFKEGRGGSRRTRRRHTRRLRRRVRKTAH